MPSYSTAIEDIATERCRQIEQEGFSTQHDDSHNMGELANAAACYALTRVRRSWLLDTHTFPETVLSRLWPWRRVSWKPCDRRRELVKAGALIVAEIERLDRAASSKQAAE